MFFGFSPKSAKSPLETPAEAATMILGFLGIATRGLGLLHFSAPQRVFGFPLGSQSSWIEGPEPGLRNGVSLYFAFLRRAHAASLCGPPETMKSV
jgi:hypothetical protein